MKNCLMIVENNCERSNFLCNELIKDGYEVANYPIQFAPKKPCVYVFSPAKKLNASDFENIIAKSIIFGGSFVNTTIAKEKNCLFFSFMDDKEFLRKNSIITAEATAKIISDNTKIALYDTNILVLGYGNLSKALQHYLSHNVKKIAFASFEESELSLCPNKYVKYKNKEFCNYLQNYEVIINTIPKVFFDIEDYIHFKNKTLFIDLASVSCFENGKVPDNIEFLHARNLPSIIAPKTAALELKKSITKILDVIIEDSL